MNRRMWLIIGGILVVIVIGVVLFTLASNKKDPEQTQAKTTLVYWGLWEPEGVMQSLIDKYEKLHTNIEIQYVHKPFTQYEANVYTRIQQNFVDNTPAPDIVRINNAWLSKFRAFLSPLPSSVMTASEYSTTFYPTALKDFTGIDGNIYAIPLEIDGLSLFYNKKLFNAAGISTPPTDWDAFIEAAKRLTITSSNGEITQAGAALGTSKNIKHSADILNLLFLQNGIEVISSDNKTVTLTSTRALSAMDFYTSFVTDVKCWSPDLSSDLEAFYSGKLAMMLAPSWRAFDIINSAPNIEFSIAPVPQLPGNNPVNYAMYWGEAVPKTSQNQIEAWNFVKYLSQAEQMKEMFSNSSQIRAFGEPYSRVDIGSELSSNPYAAAVINMAPTMKAWQMGEQGVVEDSLKTAINDVVEGEIETGTALKDAEDRINAKLLEIIE